MTDIPHFSLPFRIASTGVRAAVVEQDSDDEVEDCVQIILSTTPGERIGLPDFGTPDQVFRENGVDVSVLTEQIRRFEDRASVTIVAQAIAEDASQNVTVNFRLRSE